MNDAGNHPGLLQAVLFPPGAIVAALLLLWSSIGCQKTAQKKPHTSDASPRSDVRQLKRDRPGPGLTRGTPLLLPAPPTPTVAQLPPSHTLFTRLTPDSIALLAVAPRTDLAAAWRLVPGLRRV